jgi:hypothetical protein
MRVGMPLVFALAALLVIVLGEQIVAVLHAVLL